MKVTYNPKLKEYAKELRKRSTLSEILLWNILKNKQMKGYKFSRQKPIGNYIVDFFCNRLRLAIEIDGSTHFDQMEKDEKRQKELEKLDIRFLRFGDTQVKQNMESVILEIKEWINENE